MKAPCQAADDTVLREATELHPDDTGASFNPGIPLGIRGGRHRAGLRLYTVKNESLPRGHFCQK